MRFCTRANALAAAAILPGASGNCETERDQTHSLQTASVEEAELLDEAGESKGEGVRPRANTKMMMDTLLGSKDRRIWHSREPCLLSVKDEDDDDSDEEA